MSLRCRFSRAVRGKVCTLADTRLRGAAVVAERNLPETTGSTSR